MFLKTLITLAVFATIVSVGSALKCYVCAGTSSSDCAQGKKPSMGIQLCPSVSYSRTMAPYIYGSSNEIESNLQTVCLKFTATNFDPNVIIRECGVFPASVDPCDFLQKHAPVSSCKACKTDTCNVNTYDPVVETML